MARLTADSPLAWTSAQSRAQFAALAQLRWSLFRNAFRRKGGTGELVARILLLPFLALIAAGPIVGAGAAGYYLVSSARLELLPALTWGVFLLWQLVSINISPPSLSFDINIILRFPISFARYLTARLFFGILSASNVIGTLALLSADLGIGMARHSLVPWTTLLLGTFAVANIFFTRMIFAWVDRWLSTRRARELLTALLLVSSLGFQYLNVTFNPGLQNGHHHHADRLPLVIRLFHLIEPLAALLPPGLTATSILSFDQGRFFPAIASLFGLIAFAALFLAIYAWRMHREFAGENLSEAIAGKQSATPPRAELSRSLPRSQSSAGLPEAFFVSPALTACLQKEFIYLRRNTNQLFGFLAPVFMVFLFAGRIGAGGSLGSFIFPTAVAYAILGVSILSYNNLGMDGAGVQLYFLAPAPLREVFLAKNLIGFSLNLIELLLIYLVLRFSGRAPSNLVATATLCWLLFTVFTNSAVGNYRSLTAPKRIDIAKISRQQTSQLSALIALAVIIVCLGMGFGVVLLARSLGHPWVMVPVLLAFSIAAFAFYVRTLNRLDVIALSHREALTSELCKA